MVRTLHLYRFRYFDALRQRWIMARYVCDAPEIRCRYADFELVGTPEVRHVPDDPAALSAAHLQRGSRLASLSTIVSRR